MNRKFFESHEKYHAFRKAWSNAVNSEKKYDLDATDHALYALLRGKEWKKNFHPTTNKKKLENGQRPFFERTNTEYYFKLFSDIKSTWGTDLLKPRLRIYGDLVTVDLVRIALKEETTESK